MKSASTMSLTPMKRSAPSKFGMSGQGKKKGMHFTSVDLQEMGESICKSLHRYLKLRQDVEVRHNVLVRLYVCISWFFSSAGDCGLAFARVCV